MHGSVQRGTDRCVEVCEGIEVYRVMKRCEDRCMEVHRGAWRYAEVHSRVCGGATNSNQGPVMMCL